MNLKSILKLFSRLGVLELIAFIDGACLMMYELVAARLLAPYIGSSVYVWTSVIGVIIAALSLGYAVGGYLADKRGEKADLIWLILAISGGVVATMWFYVPILSVLASIVSDPRLQGLLASLILFAPTSFLLGMISPYLVRLQLHSLSRTGRTVATISALNSVGGIVGTFSAGFVIFSFLGSRETLLLIACILVATSWLLLVRYKVIERVVLSVMILGFGLLGTAYTQPNVLANIDTASANYSIQDVEYAGETIRVLKTGPNAYQSGKNLSQPEKLIFWYTHVMADTVDALPDKKRILIIGSGAFSLPEYFGQKYPNLQIDVVDIDPELETISKIYFEYTPQKNIRFITGDGRAFINDIRSQPYDAILVDAFSNSTIPFSLTTKEFAQNLRKNLTPQGVVAMNIIASTSTHGCRELLDGISSSFESSFYFVDRVFEYPDNTSSRQNIILLAHTSPQTPKDTSFDKRSASFSDNFAPIEQISYQCAFSG